MIMSLLFWNKLKEKKKKKKKLQKGFLLANTELLLRWGSKSNPISIFSEKELEQASNNYHSDQLLYSDDSSYDFYKGVHQNRIILIKKFKKVNSWNTIEKCISEIVSLSQINHVNVVKLLGCCLETECAIQVYEFCFNRNLWDCIHTKEAEAEATDDQRRLLSWEERLRVASEIAYAVTYLHTANPEATIHRNIKPINVLLDQNGVAKLFDLSLSLSIPSGTTHVEAEIVGTFGYLAPEDFHINGRYIWAEKSDFYTTLVSEKSDVYSFGMLLFEFVTGAGISDLASETDDMKLKIREGRVREIVEPSIWNESVDGMMNQKQQQEFIKLAVRCTETMADERPTMMEVAKVLDQIKSCAPTILNFSFLLKCDSHQSTNATSFHCC